MKKHILTIVLILSLISCKKEGPELASTEVTQTVTAATVITDPVNYPPGVSSVKTNAIQLNYGVLKVSKSMTLTLNNISPDVMANYSVHIYLKSAGKYIHMPASTASGIAYNYSLKASYPYCSATITRPVGTAEQFEDVIVVAAKNSYLLSMNPTINFTDYNVVKLRLDF